MAFHQLIVDAYAVQHPGGGDRRAVQSVGIHLMTLAMFIEDGVDQGSAPVSIGEWSSGRSSTGYTDRWRYRLNA